MEQRFIKEIEITGIWGSKHFLWQDIKPDVNILVGINGSGKSTLINLIWGVLNGDVKHLKRYDFKEIILTLSDETRIVYDKGERLVSEQENKLPAALISTFDIVPSKNSKTETPLCTALMDIIYTTGKGRYSFFDYRLKAINYPERAQEVQNNIKKLFEIIDNQFERTNKHIRIDVATNRIVFERDGDIVQLENLSSGEKQFLFIIFKVFLMEGKPYVLFMDEPEISLHIDWQYELINVIRQLNPNSQLMISTHSPGIFGDGWGEKVTFADDITK